MHKGFETDGDGGTDANQTAVSGPPRKGGFVPLGIPLSAVIARLRGRTLVKVLAANREVDEGDQR
ncbi:hypothetical protein [Rhizobium rhizogenes]|nr:hypothetical protein [Rhizobium rhizogenes]